MASIRTTALAVALSAVVATSTARNVPGPTLWELNNRTSTASSGIHLLANDDIIVSFCGLDLVGGDVWNGPAPNPDTCVSKCGSGCDAATWTNYNGGTCWYKRFQGSWASAVPSVGAVSFIRTSRNTPSYMGPPGLPAYNVDMPGNDLTNVPGQAETDCIRPCATNTYCFAYTWSNYNGGTCWLKSKASPFVAAPGVMADFTGRVTNPDTCLAKV